MAGDVKSALAVTTEFTDDFPRHAKAYTLLGQLNSRAGNPAKAIKNFKRAAEYATKRGDALLTLANAQLNINDRAAAAKTFQKAIVWDAELSGAYIALIRMAIEDGNGKTGFALLDQLRKISKPESPAADILSGDLHMALKKYKKARKFYQAALKIADNPVAILGLYQMYRKTGRMDRAIATLEGWHKKYPEDIRTALSLGNAYKRDGQLGKAVIFHEKLLVKNPDMPIILNNAANLNYLVGQGDKALGYARKANELMPDNPSILDTLAWIETRRNRPEKALPLLRKALVLRFSDPEIKYHLAMTLDQLDRRGEAEKLLVEAVSSGTDFPDKAMAQDILQQWQGK